MIKRREQKSLPYAVCRACVMWWLSRFMNIFPLPQWLYVITILTRLFWDYRFFVDRTVNGCSVVLYAFWLQESDFNVFSILLLLGVAKNVEYCFIIPDKCWNSWSAINRYLKSLMNNSIYLEFFGFARCEILFHQVLEMFDQLKTWFKLYNRRRLFDFVTKIQIKFAIYIYTEKYQMENQLWFAFHSSRFISFVERMYIYICFLKLLESQSNLSLSKGRPTSLNISRARKYKDRVPLAKEAITHSRTHKAT